MLKYCATFDKNFAYAQSWALMHRIRHYGSGDRDHIFISPMLTCFISESRVFISTIRKLAEFIIRHFAGEY
jgi:hypothetical protein